MNKKYLILAVVVVALIAFGIYTNGKRKTETPSPAVSTSTPATTTPAVPEPPAKVSLLQPTPYTSQFLKMSLYLPKGWTVQDQTDSTTTPSVLFGNGTSTLTVKRFIRNDKVDSAVLTLDTEQFLVFIADGLKDDIPGYTVVATSTVSIQGVNYYKIIGSYTGVTSKKPVTQYAYLTLTDKAYYIVGADVYSSLWQENKDAVLGSISTIKLLPQ